MCNIENDLFDNNIQYAYGHKKENETVYISLKYFFYRNRVNLSLLLSVLNELISEENTTVMECDKIYQRFGFKCRPIILNEGQELIRRLYEKQRNNIQIRQPQSECHSRFAQIMLKSYDYKFEAKPEPFFTNAQIAKSLKLHLKEVNALSSQDISSLEQMKDMAAKRNNIFTTITNQENDWRRMPLKNQHFYVPPLPVKKTFVTDNLTGLTKVSHTQDGQALWNSYSSEFRNLGILIKPTFSSSYNIPYKYPICISLDDLGDLPIDYSKTHIFTDEEMRKLNIQITMGWSR